MKRQLEDDFDDEKSAKRPRIRYRNTILRRVKQLREELKDVLDKSDVIMQPSEPHYSLSSSQLQEIAEWDELYCSEQISKAPKALKVKLCAHDIHTEHRSFVDMDRIDMAWRNIAGHHCNVRPTSKLEQWLVDHHAPTFTAIPDPWHPCARVIVHNRECFVGAFCSVTRRLLCSFGDYSSEYSTLVCIDANELFYNTDVLIDREFDPKTKTLHSFGSRMFPLMMSIDSVMNICKVESG